MMKREKFCYFLYANMLGAIHSCLLPDVNGARSSGLVIFPAIRIRASKNSPLCLNQHKWTVKDGACAGARRFKPFNMRPAVEFRDSEQHGLLCYQKNIWLFKNELFFLESTVELMCFTRLTAFGMMPWASPSTILIRRAERSGRGILRTAPRRCPIGAPGRRTPSLSGCRLIRVAGFHWVSSSAFRAKPWITKFAEPLCF